MTRTQIVDIVERIGATFVGSVFAAVPVTAWSDVETWQSAVFVGATAAFSAVKGLVAIHFGDGTAAAVEA